MIVLTAGQDEHRHPDRTLAHRTAHSARQQSAHAQQLANRADRGVDPRIRMDNPVLAGADHEILAGHARILAAKKLGMKEVPVIVLGHLSEAQRRALVIADNRLTLNAGWDEDLLRAELALLHDEDYDLDLPGDCTDPNVIARLLARSGGVKRLRTRRGQLHETSDRRPHGDNYFRGHTSRLVRGVRTGAESLRAKC